MDRHSAAADVGVDLTIIVPILNERDSLGILHAQLTNALGALGRRYEIIFVDDGSSDGSAVVCRDLVERDEYVLLVELRRNFGKAMALSVGFQLARGEVVITMDGDLQDDASEIPRLLAVLDQGFDLVSGWKQQRHDPLSKTLPSRVFNAVTARATGLCLHDFNCGFKAYRRAVVKKLDLYGELHRYIPVLAHAKGFTVTEIPVRHHERRFGRSKYSFERFARGAFDLLTVLFLSVFRRRPLHLFGLLGSGLALTGFVVDAYLMGLWFLGTSIGDRPLLVLANLLIILGMQVLLFGLLAEMINAATYRRDSVTDAVRVVTRQGSPATVLSAEFRPRRLAVGPSVRYARSRTRSLQHEPKAAKRTDEDEGREVKEAGSDGGGRGDADEGKQQRPGALAHSKT